MYTTLNLKPMIPKIIVLILVVLLCDKNTTTCIPSCYFSYSETPSLQDQERKVPCDKNFSLWEETEVT